MHPSLFKAKRWLIAQLISFLDRILCHFICKPSPFGMPSYQVIWPILSFLGCTLSRKKPTCGQYQGHWNNRIVNLACKSWLSPFCRNNQVRQMLYRCTPPKPNLFKPRPTYHWRIFATSSFSLSFFLWHLFYLPLLRSLSVVCLGVKENIWVVYMRQVMATAMADKLSGRLTPFKIANFFLGPH